jgi:thioredoxin-dependent peroxiredoxin
MIDFKIPAPGDPAPGFCLDGASGSEVRLEDYRGRWVVLYFYPKDNTPGCTVEAQEFSALKSQFEKLNAVVLGMSPDSIQSHQNFTGKHGLQVELVSDPAHEILKQFGAWRLKKNYGKEYMGVARSTFLIDPSGVIRRTWSTVTAAGHAAEVLTALAELV